MKIDVQSFVLGLFTAVVILFLWKTFTAEKSYFTVPTFAPPMTVDDAHTAFQTAIDAINADSQAQAQAAISAGNPGLSKQINLQAQKAQMDLSLAYNTYVTSITPDNVPTPAHPPVSASPGAPAPSS